MLFNQKPKMNLPTNTQICQEMHCGGNPLQTNRMQLQYKKDKCVKMHIAKKHKPDNCPAISVESWKDEVKKT